MITALIPAVTGILDKFIPDADTKQKLSHEISTMAEKHHQQLMLAQIKVNEAEAKGNWFQSSWRPATAWVCVLGFYVTTLHSKQRKERQMSLYKNINAKKKSGTSNPKSKSTVSAKSYSAMKKGFPKKKGK